MFWMKPGSGKAVFLTLLLGICAPSALSAQDSGFSFWGFVRRLAAPSAKLDSTAVFRPGPRWNAYLTGELRKTGSTLVSSMVPDGKTLSLTMGLQERLYSGMGIYGGYGGLTVGLSREIGPRSAEFSKSNSFDYVGSGQGLQIQFLDIRQRVTYSLSHGEEDDPDALRLSGLSDMPGRMKLVTVEGMWALNRRTFALPAVYKGSLIQRRSAGSFLLGAKFLQGEQTIDPEDTMSDIIFGLRRQATMQVSLGAGYSYNLVAFHHQPSADGRGLDNLCFNLTLLPMLTLYDRLTTFRKTEGNGPGEGVEQRPVEARIRFAYLARAGVTYTRDRWSLGLSTRYDSFSFRGETPVHTRQYAFDIKTTGHFYKWSAVLRFAWKF